MPWSPNSRHSPRSASSALLSTPLRPGAGASSSVVRAPRAATSEPDAFRTEVLSIVEIDADERIAALITFDPDDFDAAFAELDARYLAGEAAAHAHTWSVIAAGLRRAQPARTSTTTPDWVNIDHRRDDERSSPVTLTAYLRAAWDLTPDISIYIEAVHRLSDLGAVVTHVAHGTSQEGFDAEWRVIDVLTVEGDLINRCEIFDEADLDAALARFDELQPQAPRLENAASQVDERFQAYFAARDWDAMAEMLADDISIDDRRRVVNVRESGTVEMPTDRRHAGASPTSRLRM